jgi:hypothetical protein
MEIDPVRIKPEDADTAVEELKHAYDKNVAKASTDPNDETYFSWKNHNMTICVCKVSYTNGTFPIAFAVSSGKEDELKIFDFVKETNNYDFFNIRTDNVQMQINYLLSKGLLPEINSDSIVATSISFFLYLKEFITNWVSQEYKHASKHFSKTPIEIFNFNNLGLHAAKYKFDVMINTINNDQFSIELSECLYAYEHEKYYLCAAGMGGILESILYFSLENYKLIDRNIPNNPTAFDFIRILKTNDLITRRDEDYIKSIFMLRNSVSHHNSGFTDASQCQAMMLGSRNIFATIFQPSKVWNKENPDLSYREYLRNR